MIGQGLDRLLDGRMSLWEADCITHAFNEMQPDESGPKGPEPSEEDFAALHERTAETVAAGLAKASVH